MWDGSLELRQEKTKPEGMRAAGGDTYPSLARVIRFSKGMRMEEPKLPSSYYLDESDPDILILRRQDGTFVAAFSAQGATREGIVDAAMEDYQALESQKPATEDEAHDAPEP